jgi:pseudouridine-5'-phosphate glycosidase
MNITAQHTKHELAARARLALRDIGGATITCLSGSIWLTMEGDSRDVMLAPGTSFKVERDGLTLLAAHEASVVQVQAKAAARNWWNRWVDFIDRTYGPAAIRPSRKWVY